MNFYNRLLLNTLTCGFLLSSSITLYAKERPSTQVKQEWKQFTSKENGFSVELPKVPEHSHQTIDVPKTDLKISYDTYMSELSESVVYVVSVWHYPSAIDMSKPEVNLQDGFNGMLSALPGSKVLNMQMSDLQGFKSLEFLVQNEDIYFQGKLLLVYNTLYQIFTVYKEKEAEDMKENYKHFIRSFKLLDPEKQKIDSNKTKVNV